MGLGKEGARNERKGREGRTSRAGCAAPSLDAAATQPIAAAVADEPGW
jgi:hypothetical protein